MDRGAWQATAHGVTKSWTRLSMRKRSTVSVALKAFLPAEPFVMTVQEETDLLPQSLCPWAWDWAWIASLLLIPSSLPSKNFQLCFMTSDYVISYPSILLCLQVFHYIIHSCISRLSHLTHCPSLQTTPFLIFGEFNIHVDNLFKSQASQFPEPLSSGDTVFHIILASTSIDFIIIKHNIIT